MCAGSGRVSSSGSAAAPTGATATCTRWPGPVDRTDADRAAITAGTKDFSPAALLFGPLGWGDALHRGSPLDPWLRLPFFVAGLVPLLLMWTGVRTWWIRWRRAHRPTVDASA